MEQIDLKPKSFTQTNFFKPDKTKSADFFKGTRVGSCSHVLLKNGQTLAVPFKIINERGRGLNHYKTIPEKMPESKSVYMNDYHPFPDMHCGMGKKPLVPYNQNSYRNRLQTNHLYFNANNRTNFEIGNCGLINRKQWSSTYKDSFRRPKQTCISNPGILSDLAKENHKKLESIN